jgi:hypothetical protein
VPAVRLSPAPSSHPERGRLASRPGAHEGRRPGGRLPARPRNPPESFRNKVVDTRGRGVVRLTLAPGFARGRGAAPAGGPRGAPQSGATPAGAAEAAIGPRPPAGAMLPFGARPLPSGARSTANRTRCSVTTKSSVQADRTVATQDSTLHPSLRPEERVPLYVPLPSHWRRGCQGRPRRPSPRRAPAVARQRARETPILATQSLREPGPGASLGLAPRFGAHDRTQDAGCKPGSNPGKEGQCRIGS